ncbi:hypothetical protein GCM10011391_25040 [Pullulanibacillus camelliae]|uniref:Intracellular proteinase inhibitor BsuPI domain-containing protein n=1 Tax=Pullulanibacillus camelliae TaxID=1707096 RepID=A0A8J3DVU1_9BACL|nr:BsuPI-related putative proteinase inhibitor [Pullulanibacillus camelliae]GGE45201.1 hypothetical protein GCM10011391_25040 [Pullulanibacillus camelliae]
MKKLVLIILFLIITSACTNTKSNSSSSPTKANVQRTDKLEAAVKVEVEQHHAHFLFSIKNISDQALNLSFHTAQRFDYEIKDSQGRLVKKYSTGQMFAQVMDTISLKKGEVKQYKTIAQALSPGTYHLTMWLNDQAYKPRVSTLFTIK